MKTLKLLALGLLATALTIPASFAQAPGGAGGGGTCSPGPGCGQRFKRHGRIGQMISPEEREKLKNAFTKAKDDPAVKAARDKLRGADRRAAIMELHKAIREAIVKADPSMEATLKKVEPMMRHRFARGAFRGRGPRHMLGVGPMNCPRPYGGNPAWRGGRGFQYRRGWGQTPPQWGPGYQGRPWFQPRRNWTQPPPGANPPRGQGQPGPGGPNPPPGSGPQPPPPPPTPGPGYGPPQWQGPAPAPQPQAPPPPPGGWQYRRPGWGGGPPWRRPNFQ